MSRLYIAEKPSMAAEIAKCLPNAERKNGYFETAAGRVTWAVGHVLQQAEPEDYDPKYKQWRTEDLPIIPEKWKLFVSPSCKNQFEIISALIKDASEIVHAGDPDREGQLLIDEILEFTHNKKPVLRLLLNALDEKSVRRALSDLRSNKDFYNLGQSALGRSRADWLYGMNFSRAYSLAAQKRGHEGNLSVGRVQTPTLSLVVRREEEIRNFKPVNYYILKTDFEHLNGAFQTTWKAKDTQVGLDSKGRLLEKESADNLLKKFKNEETPPVIVQCNKSQKKESHRLPYSLSALQIEAGRKFGYSPQDVLDTAQKLYESKLTSYPRSDCDYLPENQLCDATLILDNLMQINQHTLSAWANNADINIRSRAWNDAKITAHHAIIPTTQACDYDNLSDKEKNIYFLIAQAYIAQFYPIHIYNHTEITVNFSGETFTASGRTVVENGWHNLFKKAKKETDAGKEETDEVDKLPLVEKGDQLKYLNSLIADKVTEPPDRFIPSTLLEAMKNIHAYVKNPELKKQLKNVAGIGTEATRASIISKLIEKGFLQEEKKYLIPTERAYLLVRVLPDELTYPDETARWEMTFEKMVDGSVVLDDFISEQEAFITELCRKAGSLNIAPAQGISCPVCKEGVLRKKNGANGTFWSCSAFPDCKTSFNDDKGKPQIIECPVCKKNVLKKRKGNKGYFWGCGGYPDCNTTFEDKNGKPVLEKKDSKSKK